MISTQAAALAGMQPAVAFAKTLSGATVAGAPQSMYAIGGSPLTGLYPNTGLTGGTYSSSSTIPQGFLYHKDPPSGNAYLARLIAAATQPCSVLLCDRLWDCEVATASTSAQTITSPTLPARDALGGTNGVGVQMAIEVVAQTSATAAVLSMSYTNSAGTSGQTAAFLDLPLNSSASPIGRFFRIGLAAGDQGVRSVQSVTFSTDFTSGTLALVAYRVVAKLDLQLANVPNAIDVISGGFPRIYNGSCLFFVIVPSTTTTSTLTGSYVETQG